MSEGDEGPHELPDGWVWATFSTVATIAANLVPPQNWLTLPHVAPDNIARDTGRLLPYRTIAEDGVTSAKHLFKPGQLLYSKIRPYLNKCVRVDFRGLCSADMYPLDAHIDLAYLHSYILSRQFVSAVSEASGSRTVLPKTNKQQLSQVPVPVAPLDEQPRIAAAIDSYLTRLDNTVATLERVARNLTRYRASLLRSAVEGRLVPTEAQLARQARRGFEPAIELLTRFPAPPRPNRWNSRSSDIVLGHAALAVGNPETALPDGWTWVPLVDVARMESGHTPSRAHPEWWDGDVPWLSIPDARDHDGRTIQDTTQHTNAAGLENSAARVLPSGTVSICRTAFSIGYVVVLGRPMATSQDFVNWTPTGAVSPHWLRIVFGVDREALRRFGKGSVNKTVYFPEWLSIHVALPPLAEQERIVTEVDRLLSLAESAEVSVGRNLRKCHTIRQSILKWAFEGRLADQDPRDEHATLLIDRINSSRSADQSAPQMVARSR